MPDRRQILFIQAGGDKVHDEWDAKLVDGLAKGLGAAYELRYPRMPSEGDPSYAGWAPAIPHEVAALSDGAIVVGHSVGATVLIHVLAERPPEQEIGAIILLAAPFVGAGGWRGDEFELAPDLGQRLPRSVPVHVFHGWRTPQSRHRTLTYTLRRSRRHTCIGCPDETIS